MGTVSAIPDNLYQYSDNCTKPGQDLETWVIKVLGPAITEFLDGALWRYDGTNVDTVAVSRRVYQGPLLDQLTSCVRAATAIDRGVREVGRAFAQAGNHPKPDAWWIEPYNVVVRTTEETIDRNLGPSPFEFARFPLIGLPKPFDPAYLSKYARDPEFAKMLLRLNGNNIIAYFLDGIARGDSRVPLEDIVRILTAGLSDPKIRAQVMPDLLATIKHALDGFPLQGGTAETRTAQNAATLQTLTAILSRIEDPQLAGKLIGMVGEMVLRLSPSEIELLTPDLEQFLTAAMPAAVQRPPAGADLREWAGQQGAHIKELLLPFLKSIKDSGVDLNRLPTILRSMFQGVYINIWTTPLAFIAGPASAGGTVGLWLIINAAVGATEGWIATIDGHNPWGIDFKNPNLDLLKFNHVVHAKSAIYAIVASLIANGSLINPGTGDPFKLSGGPEDIDLVMRVTAEAKTIKFDDPKDGYLVDLINAFRINAVDLDPADPLVKLLTE